MKRIAIITVCCLLAAGLCLAQSDSANVKRDSIKVSVEVQNKNTDSASVTVTTEKGTADSTTTVTIRSGRERDRNMHRRDWVLGCRLSNLSFGSFPGTVFLQRRIRERGFISLGLNCDVDKEGPTESYHDDNAEKEESSGESAYIRLTPGYTFYRTMRSWLGSLSIEGSVSCSFGKSERKVSQYGIVHQFESSVSRSWNYGLELPFALERRFKIRNMVYSVGLRASVLSMYSSYSKTETTNTDLTPVTVTNKRISPIRVTFASPFNGSASIQLKYWF